jgi:hypothetical protein
MVGALSGPIFQLYEQTVSKPSAEETATSEEGISSRDLVEEVAAGLRKPSLLLDVDGVAEGQDTPLAEPGLSRPR